MKKMSGKRVAILATHGFEQAELEVPLKKLKDAGATVEVVSPEKGEIKGWDSKDWGHPVKVDRNLADVSADDYDAIVLPGGQINPDLLRVNAQARIHSCVLRSEKSRRRGLPCAMVVDRDRNHQRAQGHVVSLDHRRDQCRRQVGRFSGCDRSRGDHLAPAQRPRRLFRQDHRRSRRRPSHPAKRRLAAQYRLRAPVAPPG